MNTKNDPYNPENWSPPVDVVVRPPEDSIPNNFYWHQAPNNRYSDKPPKSETKLVRRHLTSFNTQQEADEWAHRYFEVVEILHTARIFCWRVKNG